MTKVVYECEIFDVKTLEEAKVMDESGNPEHEAEVKYEALLTRNDDEMDEWNTDSVVVEAVKEWEEESDSYEIGMGEAVCWVKVWVKGKPDNAAWSCVGGYIEPNYTCTKTVEA